MLEVSRRDALRTVAGGGALLLAGCSGEASRSREVPSHGDPVSDVEARFARDVDGDPLYWHAEDTPPEDRDGGRLAGPPEYLTEAEDRDELSFSGTPPGEELRSFVDATDFGAESVYLIQLRLGECYRLGLVQVVREADGGVSADFCRELRAADAPCSAGAHDVVGVAVRLPFAGDQSGGLGTGMSSRCSPERVIAREGAVER